MELSFFLKAFYLFEDYRKLSLVVPQSQDDRDILDEVAVLVALVNVNSIFSHKIMRHFEVEFALHYENNELIG